MNCVFRLQAVKHFHEISKRPSIIKEVKTFDDITSDNFNIREFVGRDYFSRIRSIQK
jgi:hypothetical protein